ncbi:MAG: beta-ketoacyl-[acyl-carrier-protein] synthase family protein [Actinomycetota bacterium]|nr:beta-ketoacyl-[acyl-carrier-protein] synthase family protein [Actinomycetota bacterium]
MTESAAVITGIGLLSPLGRGVDTHLDRLWSGESGLVAPPRERQLDLPVDAAGFAPDVLATDYLSGPDSRLVDRFILLGLAAADDALADAGIVVGTDCDPERTAVVVSSANGGLISFEQQALSRAERGRTAVSPMLLPAMLPNMASARIAIQHGIRGASSNVSTACAAGAQGVAEALRIIRDGDADVVLCGGVETPLTPTIVATFVNSRALAKGWPDPRQASRPFDKARNGFVLAEGAGVLVVESAAHAAARGARGYANLLGWGSTTDGFHVTSPRPDGSGAAAAMRRALSRAGVSPSDVGYVNAHGTATKLGDSAEAAAIRELFGESGPAVSSTKGAIGHLLGGAGAVEAAITALSISTGRVPPTLNLDDPDPACDLDHVRGGPRTLPLRAALSNSFAFGGHNVSLLLGESTVGARHE